MSFLLDCVQSKGAFSFIGQVISKGKYFMVAILIYSHLTCVSTFIYTTDIGLLIRDMIDLAEDVSISVTIPSRDSNYPSSVFYVLNWLPKRMPTGITFVISTSTIPHLDLPRVLSYVKNAIGETDVPDSLPEFIGQRRRWLNGSFFAAVYALVHTKQILLSGHSGGRKIFLMIESAYNLINIIFAWFAIVSPQGGVMTSQRY